MRIRRLVDQPDLESFREHYHRRGGAPVDLACLQGSFVYAAERDGRMVGGYVVRTQPPFRYVEAFPQSHAELLGAERVLRFCEATGIWLGRDLGPLARVAVYLSLGVRLSRSGRRYVLGGAAHPRVLAMYQLALPDVLHEGEAQAGDERFWGTLVWGRISTMWQRGLCAIPGRLWRGRTRRHGGRPTTRRPQPASAPPH